MLAKSRALGIEGRGVSDHGSIHSLYFRDPNGYVVELCARIRPPIYDEPPRDILQRWNLARATAM
jgi:catechol-2,3-dioxygenase